MATYTDATTIAAALGVTFTTEQAARAAVVAAAITAWIDTRTGRSWQTSGAITAELHQIVTDRVYLSAPPVTAVSSVTVHPGTATGTWQSIDPSAYQVFSPESGLLLVSGGYAGQWAQVDYTSATTAPDDIMAAADVLAADLMLTTLNPESAGAESVSVGQNDITVRYAGSSGQQSASVKQAIAAIDAHRRPVLA